MFPSTNNNPSHKMDTILTQQLTAHCSVPKLQVLSLLTYTNHVTKSDLLNIQFNNTVPSTHSPSKPFPHQTLHAALRHSPSPCYMPGLACSSCCDLRNNIWWYCRSFGSLYNSLHSPVTVSLLGPNIPLSTIFSNISLRFVRSVSDLVSHPYKTKGRTIVLCILTFAFWIAYRKTKHSETE